MPGWLQVQFSELSAAQNVLHEGLKTPSLEVFDKNRGTRKRVVFDLKVREQPSPWQSDSTLRRESCYVVCPMRT